MSAQTLRNAAETLRFGTSPIADDDLGQALADWLDDMAEAYDWCAERWEDPDMAASMKVWGYESGMDVARLIVGEGA